MKRIAQLFIFVAILLAASAANAQEAHFIHTVSKGQTLYSISRMYQTTVKDLIDLNPECIANISVGQKIKIPPNLIRKGQVNEVTIKTGRNLMQTAYIDYDDIEFMNLFFEN